jgi:carboxypeptidase C (cathepsin A)
MSEPEKPATAAPTPEDSKKRWRERLEKLLAQSPCKSEASVAFASGTLKYEAVAEFIPVLATGIDDKRGEPEAAIFTTSYFARGADPARRPVCFAFNGGPGSSSVWLHLGALGPRRVAIPDDGTMPAPPYAVGENPQSWLEHFDLVFIDPPHTGYSMTASEEARKKALSADGDAAMLTECIRTWLGRHRRWKSPIYLAGESYGTTRGAIIADKLSEQGIALSGLILVSCAMDFQCLHFDACNDLPYTVFLPGYACVAQYHGKLKGKVGESPASARAAAEGFIAEEYPLALQAGARLSTTQRRRIVQRTAELIGLPATLVDQSNLRISDANFFVELLRDRGQIIGRLEARVTAPMGANRTRAYEFDPGIEALYAPYVMAAQAYFSDSLGLETQSRYEVFTEEGYKQWDYNRRELKGNNYLCTSPDLARALRRNPHLRVFVASGYYDLGTPYSASDWSLAQLDAPAEVLTRIEHHYYDAGHMMYTRDADLARLKQELGQWLAAKR